MSPVKLLPPGDIETKTVLRRAAVAHRYLAELKGVASGMPNQELLINTLALQEATESSAIENIISTLSDVYQSDAHSETYVNPAAKEIHAYARAIRHGFDLTRTNELLTNNLILEIHELIVNNKAGFRKLPGTVLRNEQSNETVYTPPQDYDEIVRLMSNLERFINEPQFYNSDPLVKMAIIHHQFESIHPFYDGNGRTGRIINILYLIQQDLLDIPVLYMSRYIIRKKDLYYKLLQIVRETEQWEEWILYMLDAVITTSQYTIHTIRSIQSAIEDYKKTLQEKAPKIYSLELLHHLFRNPYTKITYLKRDLSLSRNTIIRYLDVLQTLGLVEKIKKGRDNFYLNTALISVLIKPPGSRGLINHPTMSTKLINLPADPAAARTLLKKWIAFNDKILLIVLGDTKIAIETARRADILTGGIEEEPRWAIHAPNREHIMEILITLKDPKGLVKDWNDTLFISLSLTDVISDMVRRDGDQPNFSRIDKAYMKAEAN